VVVEASGGAHLLKRPRQGEERLEAGVVTDHRNLVHSQHCQERGRCGDTSWAGSMAVCRGYDWRRTIVLLHLVPLHIPYDLLVIKQAKQNVHRGKNCVPRYEWQ
jgi:hypothetical protein